MTNEDICLMASFFIVLLLPAGLRRLGRRTKQNNERMRAGSDGLGWNRISGISPTREITNPIKQDQLNWDWRFLWKCENTSKCVQEYGKIDKHAQYGSPETGLQKGINRGCKTWKKFCLQGARAKLDPCS